jgi:hypothetical protein
MWVAHIFDNLATHYFSGKSFSKIAGSGYSGSNDTGLNVLSYPGAESISSDTDRQKFFDIIIYKYVNLNVS